MSKGQGLWHHRRDYAFGVVEDGKEFNTIAGCYSFSGGTDKEYDPGKYPTVNKRLSPKELVVWKT